ncbi:NAD-dependent epimerase/dehydratase [Bradyrhizobium lupini HPC(L)]|uniref:UDP-glucose 4-epimerase n=1 Tax=Bradyrhizobium lupini HPC(L) TaxID=1229491 RepID=A0ABP2RZ26_RHILU|nr:NAD-dependent epimerase/dehydratase [Bradyrhizobium lupini HPC(L)]
MKILALGGGGFIGHHLVEDLMAAGHDVTVMGRSRLSARPLPADVKYVSGELADSKLMRKLLQDVDTVAHLVSGTVPSTGDKDPGRDVELNLLGTLSLLEDMAACNVTRILYLSSGGTVYGKPQEIPIPEGHTLDPICSYGVVKVAIESYLKLYEMKAGLRPVVIRASNPYGPIRGIWVFKALSAHIWPSRLSITQSKYGEMVQPFATIFTSKISAVCASLRWSVTRSASTMAAVVREPPFCILRKWCKRLPVILYRLSTNLIEASMFPCLFSI